MQEIYGLIDDVTSKLVDGSSNDENNWISGSGFVGSIEQANEKGDYISRLLAQNYWKKQSFNIAVKVPTLQELTQQLQLSLIAFLEHIKARTRGI